MKRSIQERWHRIYLSLGSTGRLGLSMVVTLWLLMAGARIQAQGTGWTEPVMLSTNTISSWFPDVAVDAWGQPHVVWNSGRPTQQGQMDLLMYSTLTGQGWMEPNDIQVTAYGGYTVRPAIAVDDAGRLHVTFRGGTKIYYTSSPVSDAWRASAWTPRRSISGAGNGTAYYSDVAVDRNGIIHVVWNEGIESAADEQWMWLGTSEGALLYDGRDWREEEFLAELAGRQIYAVFEDRAGVQWFGTDDGVYRFDGVVWQRLTVRDGLIGSKVNCIAQDQDDRLWFGTDRGVSVYDEGAQQEDQRWTAYTVGTGLPDSRVYAMVADPFGELWVGTANGLAAFDGESWARYTPQDGLAGTEVLALAVDIEGAVWVGTSQGISRRGEEGWTTYRVEDGLISDRVTAIAVDLEDRIWVGTDRGVSRLDGGGWISFVAGDGLPDGTVVGLAVDGKGMVWVGTEGGVSRYRNQGWESLELPQEARERRLTAVGLDRQVNAICPSCADIFYRRSTDGGQTWSTPVNLSRSFAGSVKPQIRVGGGGDVYVTWEEGEDWYLYEGYPVGVAFIHSPDGGNTWMKPVAFSSPRGAPQQITMGDAGGGHLIVVWRLPEEEVFYYQVSTDNGATWSEPRTIPGVIAKPWAAYSLDAYDAATDSAGHIHLVVLGMLYSPSEDLGVIHLVWDGTSWSPPTRIFASSDPPEWPRIAVGAGNQVYAVWFNRDERHIEDPDHGRYKVWVSSTEADAPPQNPPPLPTATPTPPPAVTAVGPEALSSPTPVPTVVSETSKPPEGLYTENDEVSQVALALLPIFFILFMIAVLRLGLSRRGR